MVNATPRLLYFREWPVPIVQEAGLASGPVYAGAENLTPPDPPARSESLYRLRFHGLRKITLSNISFGSLAQTSPVHLSRCVTHSFKIVYPVYILRQGWRPYGRRAQSGTLKDFLGTLHSLVFKYFYFFCPLSVSILWRTCVYTHISGCVEIMYELPLLPNNTASEPFFFTQIGSGAKCWLDVYDWGTSLSLTGWIRDIGQNVLQASF